MDDLENKFLHKINLETLKKETGMSLEEIADMVVIGSKVVYKWQYMHKDSSRPDYNALIRLLERGATTETLFGITTRQVSPPQQSGGNISMGELARFFSEVAKSLENLEKPNLT